MADVKKQVPKSPKASTDSPHGKAKLEDVTIEEATPAYMLKRINALKNVQLKMVNLEAKFYEELHQLECKYTNIYDPLYDRRKKIVVGEVEPTDEEGKWALDEENMTEEEKAKAAEEEKAEDPTEAEKHKGIEHFWLETLQSFRITADIVQEHDEPVLAHLQDMRIRMSAEKPYGYTLEFHFSENPYFTNTVLTKKYELKTDVDPKDPFSYEGPDLGSSIGCTINWNAGKNVTVKTERRKIKSKNKKAPAKVVSKEIKVDSFFNFFDTIKASDKSASSGAEGSRKVSRSGDDEDSEADEDEEEDARLVDFEIGQYIKEKVIPKAVLYYTGEYDGLNDEYDDYEDGEEGDEDEDDDDEDDDEDDEDDDDEEEEHHGKKGPKGGVKGKHGKPHPKSGAAHQAKGGEPTPSECKQN